MADDSGDSDIEPRPSCSKKRRNTRGNNNHGGDNCTENRKGRQRRIVMRIEFDDSGEDSSSVSEVSVDDGNHGNNVNELPSTSKRTRSARKSNKARNKESVSDESDNIQWSKSQRLRNRRTNLFCMNGSDSDESSSGSEINRLVKTRVKKPSKKIIISEDEQMHSQDEAFEGNSKREETTEAGFNSDSSSNELLEKCPICLLTFRQQEIGSPATCAHIFCASCIEAWSKNVQTCPIDRIEFDRLIVRDNYENRKIVREVNLDPKKKGKELTLDDETEPLDEDVTNCEICNSPEREDVMLLCDECNQGYHMDCLTPRLTQIPEGSWYCDNCFDPSGESDDVSEELNLLYEDIRDMGIPQTALRVTELQQPRILRTRQNERIRAAVLRTTRSRARIETTTTTTTSTGTGRGRGRPLGSTTTTTTTTTRRTRSSSTLRKPTRRRRGRARRRTYVVEYDVNNFDEKFAIKTTKKIIKRRRRKRRRSARGVLHATTGERMTASKRLAEQMGVKRDPTYTSHLSGTSAGLSLFGGANDLEYFSDSDNGGIEHEIQVETGHGTAVQTSIRISNFGSQRAHKGILLGRLRGNNRSSVLSDLNAPTIAPAGGDLLSSIMDIQDRWHNAARHMENVHINADGTLQLPSGGAKTTNKGDKNLGSADTDPNARHPSITGQQSDSNEQLRTPINPLEGVTQAPLYSRGGGNQNFNSGGGGGSGGNYNNNRYNNNSQSNYRGTGGGQYRHSTGGSGGGDIGGNNNSMVGRGNFNFSNQNFNSNTINPNQPSNFSPFSIRFNTRNNNNQRNNNQRNSLPFMHRGDEDRQQQQQQQQQQNQSQNMPNEANNLFGGLPPPIRTSQPVMAPSQLMSMTGPPPMSGPPSMPTPPHMPGPPPIMGPLPMTGPPPPTMGMSGLPLPLAMQSMRPIMTVPPPPAPPPGVPMPWGTPIFQQLNNDYGNDDDDDTICPNFSVYSTESQEIAKSTEMQSQAQQAKQADKEDDENEDLVQLDDDDEIPMPPETNPSQSTKVKDSDLYEPENPTEENEDENEKLEEQEKEQSKIKDNDNEILKNYNEEVENAENLASPIRKQRNNHSPQNDNAQYHTEHEITSNDGSNADAHKITNENIDESNKSAKETNNKEPITNEHDVCDEKSEHTPSPSPILSETKLPENDLTIANKKGVLELYDDSDWEELDIDKPKEYEKAVKASSKSDIEESQCEDDGELVYEKEKSKKIKDKGKEIEDKNESEPDRSYTPCLDENIEPEESQENGQNNDAGLNSSKEQDDEAGGKTPDVVASEPTAIETELISDDEDNPRGTKKRRNSKKRDKRDKKVETFKKVSKKQKIRNYRTDKQQSDKLKERRRSMNSRSRSISKSKSKSRSHSRSRTRSRSRIRSRTRSPRAAVSRSRSPRSARSRSRSPRGRGRRRSRSVSFRSRSRSNNKENNWGKGSRFNNNQFNKFQDRNKNQSQYRPKRREIQRYNVRNVVGIQRNFREEKEVRDRYGRDANRPMRKFSRSPSPRRRRLSGRSFSRSHSRGRSMSPRRNRRGSFSMSPTPQPLMRRQSVSPRQRYQSPRRHSLSPRRITPMRAHSRSPMRLRSRSMTPQRMAGRKVIRRVRGRSPLPQSAISRSPSPLHSISESPRYTPRLHRSRSKTPLLHAAKGKKKKLKEKGKKKKKKQRLTSLSPDTNIRISRQRDAFEVDRPPKKKRRHSPKQQPPIAEPTWSPSPSPPPVLDYERDNNVSWTPPLLSPRLVHEMHGIYEPEPHRSDSPSGKRDKRKRLKKKKKGDKRRELRKDKRRIRRTQTPEPVPSKEVFASGNNILVSVSFNKDAAPNQQPSQTTVVTLPATREDLHTIRRNSIDCLAGTNATSKKKKKRKKLDAKPVAIIDLERSPFQVHQEPTDVIVLTDSEEGVGGHDSDHEHEHENERRRESHRERRRSESLAEEMEHHRSQMSNGIRSSSQLDKTPPLERERLETILEESYDLPQTGPKTPPEPPTVKFNITTKKQNKIRNNPLHDDNEMNSESEMAEVRDLDTHRPEMEAMHVQSSQKIGPNTPPESGPCSPDAYDPFDPTKSPSLSPRSPSPAPLNSSQGSINVDGGVEVVSTQKHIIDEQRLPNERTNSQISGAANNMTTQGPTLNPVELVMKLMNTKQNSSQDLSKSNEPQYNTANHMHSAGMMNSHDDGLGMRDKCDDPMGLTVISNVLLSNGNTQASQHIPVISSPTPMVKGSQISKLPLPKVGSSVGSSSAGMPSSNSNMRNGGLDEPVNLTEMESPYSPGSADYEDLFEPPPDSSGAAGPRRSKRTNNNNNAKLDVFDNLFGSTSPVGHARMPKKFKAIVTSSTKKAKVKVSKTDDHVKVYDDVPNSAVELQVKDKFLRKLNRQERVVEEVKLVLKPRFNKKQITKDDYKEIMRRAVPKICHSRSGEINPHKIKNLIDAYVRKFRAKHKKLNLLNTGQVSSAVKCAAYLKKL